MKKLFVILLIFNPCFLFSQNTSVGSKTQYETTTGNGMNVPHGIFNVAIGREAGKYLTTESYCVIVGHDSTAINIKGEDMIWYVNWDEPLLLINKDIKQILFQYYTDYIKTGKDDKDFRAGLVLRIINRNNKAIGKDAKIKNK